MGLEPEEHSTRSKELLLFVLVLLLSSLFFSYSATALPSGATLNALIETSSGPNNTAGSRTDPGGTLTTLSISLRQQNDRWKAYVGNVTGAFVLQNANNQSIYEWALATADGEVYISRSSSPTWTALSCADTSAKQAEDTALGLNSSTSYSINHTFNSTNHTSFTVNGVTFTGCPTTSLWVNDTSQRQDASSLWQEILLNDSSSNRIYASLMSPDTSGYDNTSTFDFQAIVADNFTAGDTTYYFFIQLS